MERHIQRTFQLNGVQPNLVMAAVGVTAGTTTFHVSQDFWASSTLPGRSRRKSVSVPVRSLNVEIARFRPTILIIDIEGGEVEVVPQADLRDVRAVIVEVHPATTGPAAARAVEGALVSAGFTKTAGDGDGTLSQRL